jgi:hypothetical protein
MRVLGPLQTNIESGQPTLVPAPLDDLGKLWHLSHVPLLLALLGGALLAAGADAPLIHIPIIGTISYLRHPEYLTSCTVGEVVLLLAAAFSIVCALLRRFKLLWLTGTVAIAQLIVTLVIFQHRAATVLAKAEQPDLVDPTLMWAGAALQRARLEWGIALIGGGAAIVITAAAWGIKRGRRSERT